MNKILPKTNWIEPGYEKTRKLSDGGYMPTYKVEGTPFQSEPKNSLLANHRKIRYPENIFKVLILTSRYLIWT